MSEDISTILWKRGRVPAERSDTNDVWAVWQAADRLFPQLTHAFLNGLTGGALRTFAVPLLYSDFTHWLLPGLSACGILAECVPLPMSDEDFWTGVRRQLRHSGGMPLFAFSGPTQWAEEEESAFEKTTNAAANLEGGSDNAPGESDPMVTRQALVIAVNAVDHTATVQDGQGHTQSMGAAELRALYSHIVLIRRSLSRGRRATHVSAMLQRWAAFACACPERCLGTSPTDAPLRALAADFWQELAGKGRADVSRKLRRVADLLANPSSPADVQAAFHTLHELACRQFLLPPFVENALLAPNEAILTEGERRELIYLVRAGTRDLKILAAHRLHAEHACADARQTLAQLRFDSDAWVRRLGDW